MACSASLFAQVNKDWVEESDIEDAKLVIEKQKVLTLPRASRSFGKMTKRVKTDGSSQIEQTYELKLLNFPIGDIEPSIRVVDDKPQPLPMLYRGYVKAGFGNYLSPYLAAYVGSDRSERHAYGVSFRHLSALNGPVDKDFSASGQTSLQAYGKLMSKRSILAGEVGYTRRNAHFYGYVTPPTEADSTLQVFNDISFQASWENRPMRKGAPWTMKTSLKGNFFTDNYTAKEINAVLSLGADMALGNGSAVSVELQHIANLRYWADTLHTNRSLAKATVTWNYTSDKLSVAIGGRVAYDFDTTTNISQITAYPVLDLRYDLSPNKVSMYLKATGDLKQQTLQQLTQENPFLNTNTGLRNTHQIVDASLGFRIAATSRVGVLLEGGYDLSKNRALMLNGINPALFEMAYDGAMTGALHVKGGVTANIGRIQAMYTATYWQYSMDAIAEAYHLPTLSNQLSVAYRYRKLGIKLDAFQWSGLKALDGVTLVELDAIFDVNLRGEYQVTEAISAFVSLKNLASQNYERFYRYPVRGINVLVGGTYIF